MKKTATNLILVTSLVALAACAPKRKVADIPPPPVATNEVVADPNAGRPMPGSQADFIASVSADRVLFDTDKFDIDAEDQATLRSQSAWLVRYPNTRVTIEGHADERPTGPTRARHQLRDDDPGGRAADTRHVRGVDRQPQSAAAQFAEFDR